MKPNSARRTNGTPALFRGLTTPHIADACLKEGVEVRCAPSELQAMSPTQCRVAGRVRPVRHYGSVDVFLEALEHSTRGEVLVIDNGGRKDESCVGDLIALESKNAGVSGIVIWGLHRDSAEIAKIGLPLFSLGACPTGPLRLDPRSDDAFTSARVGPWTVGLGDIAVGDENGVIFIPQSRAQALVRAARAIRAQELAQARAMGRGTSLRTQLRFSEFLSERSSNPRLSLRDHLRRVGAAIEA
jgi:4-hydroxy-4-methyl-2-oxoglutarate aldolase